MISIFSKNDSMKRFHLGSSTKKHILSAWETAKPRKMPNRTESRPTRTAMYLIYRLKPFKSIENPKRNDGFSPEHEKIEKNGENNPETLHFPPCGDILRNKNYAGAFPYRIFHRSWRRDRRKGCRLGTADLLPITAKPELGSGKGYLVCVLSYLVYASKVG